MSEKNQKARGVKITSDGVVDILVFNKQYATMEELQSIVNGHFEFVYLPENMIMVVNEEGKLNDLPINSVATAFVKPVLNDYIVGDVLLINQKFLN
jgi:hypothetical protein